MSSAVILPLQGSSSRGLLASGQCSSFQIYFPKAATGRLFWCVAQTITLHSQWFPGPVWVVTPSLPSLHRCPVASLAAFSSPYFAFFPLLTGMALPGCCVKTAAVPLPSERCTTPLQAFRQIHTRIGCSNLGHS